MAPKHLPTWVGLALAVVLIAAVGATRRRAFFDGKFLGADDFSDEQKYGRCRRRLH